MNFLKTKKGFTLAETLITLTILGVVAMVLISNIIKNYQKRMTITRLKMAYSMLDNMIQQSVIENGYPIDVTLNKDSFYNYYGKYLNITKECGINGETGFTGCFKSGALSGSGDIRELVYSLDGKDTVYYYNYKVVLKNGMGLGIYHGNMRPYGITIWVDIDGPKKGDSKLGQDVFQFTYYSPEVASHFTGNTYLNYTKCQSKGIFFGGYIPLQADNGCQTTRSNLKKLCSKDGYTPFGDTKDNIFMNGSGCSGLIIKDGWKISDDYPWDYAHKKS